MRIEDRHHEPKDIVARTFSFAQQIVQLCRKLEHFDVGRVLINQLLRSGTSIGANMEEAQAGQTHADFTHKCAIALKESRETLYWLRLITETSSVPSLDELISEAKEIRQVLGAIVASAMRNERLR